MIAGRRSESSQRRRARCTTARRSAMPSRHYAGTAQAAARPAAFLRIGGEKRVCSGFLGKPLPKPKSVLTRPAAARFAPEGRRSAHLRAPRSRRGPTDRRPEERSAPGPAQKPQPPPARGQMRKRKGQEQPPVLFCAYTPIRAGLPRPTYSVSARDGHQRPERSRTKNTTARNSQSTTIAAKTPTAP